MNKKTTAAILLCSAMAASGTVNTREGWSGFTEQKAFDLQGQTIGRMLATAGGARSPVDQFTQSSYFYEDPNGMHVLPSDIRARGIVFLWWHAPEAVTAYSWQVTFGGEYTKEPMPDFDGGSFGMSFFSGLLITPDERNRTIGGFGYDVENRSTDTKSVYVSTDWLGNEWVPGHNTRNSGRVPPGGLITVFARPEGDDWALAAGEPIVEVQ